MGTCKKLLMKVNFNHRLNLKTKKCSYILKMAVPYFWLIQKYRENTGCG